MRRSHLLATVGIVALVAATPVQAAPVALVLGLVAVGVVGAAIGIAASDPSSDVWDYTETHGWVGGAPEDVSTIETPLAPKPGTPKRLVAACRDAIAKTAEPYDVASLEAVSGGKPMRVKGRTVAPIEVRALYRVRGVHEVKRSTVRCQLDRSGRVVAVS